MTDDNLPPIDENHVIAERREKLAALRIATNGVAFPNDFKPKDKADVLQKQYALTTIRQPEKRIPLFPEKIIFIKNLSFWSLCKRFFDIEVIDII